LAIGIVVVVELIIGVVVTVELVIRVVVVAGSVDTFAFISAAILPPSALSLEPFEKFSSFASSEESAASMTQSYQTRFFSNFIHI
jgi:hypothetical protein